MTSDPNLHNLRSTESIAIGCFETTILNLVGIALGMAIPSLSVSCSSFTRSVTFHPHLHMLRSSESIASGCFGTAIVHLVGIVLGMALPSLSVRELFETSAFVTFYPHLHIPRSPESIDIGCFETASLNLVGIVVGIALPSLSVRELFWFHAFRDLSP